MGVYSGRWAVAVGRWAVLWAFSWTVSRNPRLRLRGGVDLRRWLHLPWHGGPILVTFEAGCAWSSRRSQRGTRWEARPGFTLVGVRQGWW